MAANTNKFYVSNENGGQYFENGADALESIQDHDGNVNIITDEAWSKSNSKAFDNGCLTGMVGGGIAMILGGIVCAICDSVLGKRKKK